jgi:hypothetical protein
VATHPGSCLFKPFRRRFTWGLLQYLCHDTPEAVQRPTHHLKSLSRTECLLRVNHPCHRRNVRALLEKEPTDNHESMLLIRNTTFVPHVARTSHTPAGLVQLPIDLRDEEVTEMQVRTQNTTARCPICESSVQQVAEGHCNMKTGSTYWTESVPRCSADPTHLPMGWTFPPQNPSRVQRLGVPGQEVGSSGAGLKMREPPSGI